MIIEDDRDTCGELTLLLKNEGYLPLPVVDFTGIYRQVIQERPDLVLMDIGLPGEDGFRCVPVSGRRFLCRLFLSQAGTVVWMRYGR